MAILNQKRILNLIPKVSAPVTIHVSQGDVGTQIEFTLVKGDEVFVNPGNVTASVHGVREDGANFGPFTCTLSNSKVTFPLHSEMTTVKGSAIAEIVIVDNGGNKVGSANFGILVEESVFPLGVTYDNDVSVYESILGYAQSSAAQIIASLNSEISARTSEDALINTRIDEIIAPSGEAPSAAEVTDARVGANGVTYASLGAAIRTQVNEMKNSYENSLEPIGIDLVITFINGGYVNTGSVDIGNVVSVTPTASSAYCYAIIPCQEGDKFTIKGTSGISSRLYAFVDSTYHLIAKSEQSLVGEHVAIAPTTSAYIIINAGTSAEHYAFKGNNEFKPVRDKVDSGLYTNYAYLATESGYIDDSGNVISNPIINHSDFIEIPIGASTAILSNSYTWGSDKYNVINPCIFYDSNKVLISVIHQQTTDVVIRTIPSNVKYVKINRPNVKRSDITARDNYFMFEASCNNRVYRVSKTASDADFSSVTECFLALKYDESPKTIEILDGDYDIFQEYKDCNVPVYTGNNPAIDFVPYCVFVPKNTHVIGKGIVRLIWMPTKESNPEITWMQCYAVSVINVMNSMTLENVELHCKNGRYCIHNDTIGTARTAGTFQKYINVRCYKYENEVDTTTTPGESHVYGTNETTGYGVNVDAFHYYENCLFENEASGRAVQGHTNQRYEGELITQQQSGEIIFDRCVFETNGNQAIQLQNSGLTQHQHVRTKFLGCYMNKPMEIDGEGVHNAYDATFLDCGEVTLKINLTDNEYTPIAIRTELTLV